MNSTIAPSIQTEILQYKADVEAEGYTVKIYNWTDLNPDPFQRVVQLNTNITQEYTTNGLNGTVLVGEMPFSLYEQSVGVDYICDLYLMDIDGLWGNPDGDVDFDSHTNGTGDMYPEIFVGRINPKPVNSTHEVALLQSYFQRNHDYRVGITARYNNSLMYIDDWGHVFIHSDASKHYFKIGATYTDLLLTSQLKTANLALKFWMLYCCYGTRFDVTDNIATQYLFSPTANNSLAVFGSSTSGGFLMNQYLYEPLGQGATLGEAFRHWWFNDILDPVVKTHGPTDPTVRGNMLLGDPTLRIRAAPGNGDPPPPTPKLTPLQLSLIIVGPIVAIGLTALIVVTAKNRKAKKQS